MARRRQAPGVLGAAAGSRFYEDGSAKFGSGDVYDPDTKKVYPKAGPRPRRRITPPGNSVIRSDPNRMQLASYNPSRSQQDEVMRAVADLTGTPPDRPPMSRKASLGNPAADAVMASSSRRRRK